MSRPLFILGLMLGTLSAGALHAQTFYFNDGRKTSMSEARIKGGNIIVSINVGGANAGSAEITLPISTLSRIDWPAPPALAAAEADLKADRPADALKKIDAVISDQEAFREIPGSWWNQGAIIKIVALARLGKDVDADVLLERMRRAKADSAEIARGEIAIIEQLVAKGKNDEANARMEKLQASARDEESRAALTVLKANILAKAGRTEEALLAYFKRFGAGSMLISIIIHVVIIICATVWVVSSVKPQRKPNFQGGGNNGSAPDVQHAVKMANTQPNLAALTQRLVVENAASSVTLPDLPSTGSSGPGSLSPGGSLGGGPGAGQGAGIGNLKGAIMPKFGFKEAQPGGTLVGNFYDFKQLSGLKPNPDYKGDPNKSVDSVSGPFDYEQVMKFLKGGWSSSSLSKYYQAPAPLYATQIFVPRMNAAEAPKAYGVEKEVQSKAWMALYRGKVSPPKDGVYRLVGSADDILLVQFNGIFVLDGSLFNRTGFTSDSSGVKKYGGLIVGKRMQLRANQFYDIKIAISEAPGGYFHAYLFFEEEGVTYEKDAKGNPILPIFRVADFKVEPARDALPFMPDGPIWKALPPSK